MELYRYKGNNKSQLVELTLNWQRPLTFVGGLFLCSDIFDFKLSFLGSKHLAKNVANKFGRFSKFLEKFFENKKPSVSL